jgi:hypothetical protein
MSKSDRINAKIVDISIVRHYGFNDGGQIVAETYDKEPKRYYFYDRSSWVEEYAKFNGINSEDKLKRLIGRRVYLTEGVDSFGNDVVWLSYPQTKCTEDWHYKICSCML